MVLCACTFLIIITGGNYDHENAKYANKNRVSLV